MSGPNSTTPRRRRQSSGRHFARPGGWTQCAAAEQPNARRLHRASLRDHLPELLHALAATLAAAGNGQAEGHARAAKQHGVRRWEDGWSLDEVIRDYQILRRVLLEHF